MNSQHLELGNPDLQACQHTIFMYSAVSRLLPPIDAAGAHMLLLLHLLLLQSFVAGLVDLPEEARAALAAMTPASYVGNAAEQAADLKNHM